MTFSEQLITVRTGKGWSQERLARELGVTRQAVGRWERSECLPDAPGLTKLSRIFDVDSEWMLDDSASDEPKPRTARNTKLIWFDWLMLALIPVLFAAYSGLQELASAMRAATYTTPWWYYAAVMPVGCLRFVAVGWSAAALFSALFVSVCPMQRRLRTAFFALGCAVTASYILFCVLPASLARYAGVLSSLVLPAMDAYSAAYLLTIPAFLAGTMALRPPAS